MLSMPSLLVTVRCNKKNWLIDWLIDILDTIFSNEYLPPFIVLLCAITACLDQVVNWNVKHKPVQGGLLVLRPDKAVYEELVEIVKEDPKSPKKA